MVAGVGDVRMLGYRATSDVCVGRATCKYMFDDIRGSETWVSAFTCMSSGASYRGMRGFGSQYQESKPADVEIWLSGISQALMVVHCSSRILGLLWVPKKLQEAGLSAPTWWALGTCYRHVYSIGSL